MSREYPSNISRNFCANRSRGQGLVEYAIILVLISMAVMGGLALTGTSVGNVYQNVVDSLRGEELSGGETPLEATPTPTPIPEDMLVNVVTSSGSTISGVKVSAFNSESAQVASAESNLDGVATFSGLNPGRYKFRAEYNGQEFWSVTISYPAQTSTTITITVREINVHVMNARGLTLADIPVHAYTDAEAYAGDSQTTNQNGMATFTLPDGSYKFRADYKGQPYWSETIITTSTTSVNIRIPEAPFTVRVTNRQGQAVSKVPVYAFNTTGDYSGISGRTDKNGIAIVDLPDGSYKFRADYDGQEYWSDAVTSPDVDSTTIQVGGTQVTVKVVTSNGTGLANLKVYTYYADDSYAGKRASTNKEGRATLELNDGSYKFRVDYQHTTYWSDTINVPQTTTATITVGAGQLTVKVVDQRKDPFPGVYVYAYRIVKSGNTTYYYYSGQYGITDGNGNVVLKLNPDTYRILGYNYNYRNYNYHFRYEWSGYISVPPTTAITLRINR
ncbi:MAG: hypothetical protein HN413_07025 [Chloroflexi bacterium]|jgi:Flp pilus assembly pilin Flp|nr:hypothetical protein [Chloroflexota bacterium]